MFSEMIHALSRGQRLSLDDLRRRLDLATVKKGGVLQQPKMCWSGDTKINPNSQHMLWAAVILEDSDALATVAGMIEVELMAGSGVKDLNQHLFDALNELSSLSSDPEFMGWIRGKISAASEKLGLTKYC